MIKQILIFILLFFLFDFFVLAQEEEFISIIQTQGKKSICRISWVDDGDTVNLTCREGKYSSVRLLGINAPDKDVSNGEENCYYKNAKEYLEKKREVPYLAIFHGSDLCKDPYKGCRNLVRLIDLKNSSDLGQSMILHGFAFSWTNFSMIPSETKQMYDWMERISSNHQLGLWGSCSIKYNEVTGIDIHTPTKMTYPPSIK